MKFYGVDMQGYYKIQDNVNVVGTYTGSDARRLVIGTDGKLYYGSSVEGNWINIQVDDGDIINTISTYLSTSYHPKNGSISESITASTYTGTSTALSITNHHVVIDSDNNSPNGDTVIYSGSPINIGVGPQVGDKYIWWNDDATNSGRSGGTLGAWVINSTNVVGSAGAIATEEWVSTNFLSGGDTMDETTLRNTFLRINDSIPFNDDYPSFVIGPLTGPYLYEDEFYTKIYMDDHFIKFPHPSEPGYWTDGVSRYASIGTTGNVAINQWNAVRRDGSCNIFANIGYMTAQYSQYADLAEKYICPELPIGTVVEVSGDEEYEVVPCVFELSPTVVGVVSENPALLMNQGSDGVPVALTGKVQVRIIGNINKGDFIVSAGDGLARKGEPHELIFKIGCSLETNDDANEKNVYCIIK